MTLSNLQRIADAAKGEQKLIGFMYLASRPCGRVAASCWDDAGAEKDTAKSVADWIKRGLTIQRIARREGDEQINWICDECRGGKCSPLLAAAGLADGAAS